MSVDDAPVLRAVRIAAYDDERREERDGQEAHEIETSLVSMYRRRLATVLGVSSAIFVAEIAVGLLANSLAVLADAAHVFADVSGIALASFASWLAARPASDSRTFGFYRVEILAAALNAVVLLLVAMLLLVNAAARLFAEPEVVVGPMLIVALFALGANAWSAWYLHEAQAGSLNVRAAYLELIGDAFGAGSVLLAAIVIALTGFRAADAIASGVIGLLIVPRTWRLLRDAVDVLLEATPRHLDMQHVRRHILEAPGVMDVHDLHAWTITSGQPVVSAHVVMGPEADAQAVLDCLAQCLSHDFDIEHSTFQLEPADRRRTEARSHD